ncbi:hypothetical protein B0T25DRAFT_315396 [Lasiosphaeria hispida]|uniref:Uncharacterized protein n=1 Tax=Lasiosphaeria hispida TaxID=260671 RepID=A0AAJ0M9X4_9PEZI|nr:hypothetical protein B0T25DRAFT_315396 [Lasiosphaeria hispida]
MPASGKRASHYAMPKTNPRQTRAYEPCQALQSCAEKSRNPAARRALCILWTPSGSRPRTRPAFPVGRGGSALLWHRWLFGPHGLPSSNVLAGFGGASVHVAGAGLVTVVPPQLRHLHPLGGPSARPHSRACLSRLLADSPDPPAVLHAPRLLVCNCFPSTVPRGAISFVFLLLVFLLGASKLGGRGLLNVRRTDESGKACAEIFLKKICGSHCCLVDSPEAASGHGSTRHTTGWGEYRLEIFGATRSKTRPIVNRSLSRSCVPISLLS